MQARQAGKSIFLATHSAGVDFSILLKKIWVNIMTKRKFFGPPVRVCSLGQTCIIRWVGLMKISLLTWKKLICAGNSQEQDTRFFIVGKALFTTWVEELYRHQILAKRTSISAMD